MTERVERWAQHQRAEAAFLSVAELLDAARVKFAPAKGIVLARWLYGDVTERPIRDVDLLVARGEFERAVRAVRVAGYPAVYLSHELGEALLDVDGFAVELHAEIGRRELTSLAVADVLERATRDMSTLPVPTLRLDDLDHLILLAGNVVKDRFVAANPHQAEDLERLLAHASGRADELVQRAREAKFLTGLHAVADWMNHVHGSAAFAHIGGAIGRAPRGWQAAALRLARGSPRMPTSVGLALACWTNDDLATRIRACYRLGKRGFLKGFGVALG